MGKKNCWEIQKCERQPGGAKVADLGECPAAIDVSSDGINGGKNGGRYCWRIVGTFCGGKVQGVMAGKIMNCIQCELFQKVKSEQGPIMRV